MDSDKIAKMITLLSPTRDGNGYGYDRLWPVMTVTDTGRSRLLTDHLTDGLTDRLDWRFDRLFDCPFDTRLTDRLTNHLTDHLTDFFDYNK